MTRCLDCRIRTQGSRCHVCQQRRDTARNHAPAQQARLSITRAQRQRIYARDHYRCVDCGTSADLTLDHLTPLAHEVKRHYRDDELATRCRGCNSSRSAFAKQHLRSPTRAAPVA